MKESPKEARQKTEFLVSENLKEVANSVLDALNEKPVEAKGRVVTLASFMPTHMRKEAVVKQVRETLISPSIFTTFLFPHIELKLSGKTPSLVEDIPAVVTILNRIYETTQYKRLYKSFLARRNAVLETLSANRFKMRVLSPIVIGLTSPLNASIPPIEPFYGFPRIPAQSVRSAIKEHLVSIGKTALANELSGEVGESSSKKGTLRTFDAVPADEQNLRINYDFTTCHSYPYYTEGEPPDDWHEPFPHLFFILPPGMVFEFAFTTGSSQVSIEEITRLMKEALSETGIGARRSRSYGILTHAE